MSLALSPMYLSTMALETTLRKFASSCLATARANSVLPVPTRRREGGKRERERREGGREKRDRGKGEREEGKRGRGTQEQNMKMNSHTPATVHDIAKRSCCYGKHLVGHRGDILWEE